MTVLVARSTTDTFCMLFSLSETSSSFQLKGRFQERFEDFAYRPTRLVSRDNVHSKGNDLTCCELVYIGDIVFVLVSLAQVRVTLHVGVSDLCPILDRGGLVCIDTQLSVRIPSNEENGSDTKGVG